MVLANEPEWPPTWLENSGASPEPVRLGGAVESVVDAVATDVEGSAADMELGAWSKEAVSKTLQVERLTAARETLLELECGFRRQLLFAWLTERAR